MVPIGVFLNVFGVCFQLLEIGKILYVGAAPRGAENERVGSRHPEFFSKGNRIEFLLSSPLLSERFGIAKNKMSEILYSFEGFFGCVVVFLVVEETAAIFNSGGELFGIGANIWELRVKGFPKVESRLHKTSRGMAFGTPLSALETH